MNLKTWLSEKPKRHKELAQRLRVSPGRITQMAGTVVPEKHMMKVLVFTGGQVTLETMLKERLAFSVRGKSPSELDDQPVSLMV